MTYSDNPTGNLRRINFQSAGWLIALVMILAIGFRLWRLNADLPYIYQSDEDLNLVLTQNMIRNGDPNPHFFHYPSLLFYLNGLVYYLYFLVGNLTGQLNTLADIPSPIMAAMGSGKIAQPNIMLASRMLSALFGVGSVLLLYLSGRKLTGSIAVGIIAATVLAVSPTHITSSQKIAPDALVVFFVLLAFYGAVGIFIEGKLGYYCSPGSAPAWLPPQNITER